MTCQARKGNGEQCNNNAKQEYEGRYCGVHRVMYEKEVETRKLKEMKGFHCGIDIGFINLSFSFIQNNIIVSYVGSIDEMIRFQEGTEPSVVSFECPKHILKHEKLFLLLENIPELKECIQFIVERQPSIASAEGCRLDGLIMGYLRGKGMKGKYLDSRTRQTFTETQVEETTSTTKKKEYSISFVQQKFPSFFAFIQERRKKVDDMCDSLIYAYISSENAR